MSPYLVPVTNPRPRGPKFGFRIYQYMPRDDTIYPSLMFGTIHDIPAWNSGWYSLSQLKFRMLHNIAAPIGCPTVYQYIMGCPDWRRFRRTRGCAWGSSKFRLKRLFKDAYGEQQLYEGDGGVVLALLFRTPAVEKP